MSLLDSLGQTGISLIDRLNGTFKPTPQLSYEQPAPDAEDPFAALDPQIRSLKKSGYTVDRVHKAIDKMTDVPDKEGAKQYASLIYAPLELKDRKMANVSGYTASSSETDARPREMASQKEVYKGAIATGDRSIPFGTKVLFPGIGIFTVEDRMNKRYDSAAKKGQNHFDIFFNNKEDALKFGRKNLPYYIIDSETEKKLREYGVGDIKL